MGKANIDLSATANGHNKHNGEKTMNTNELNEKIDGIKKDLGYLASELLEYPLDLSEYAHEQADADSDVIYCSKAHELIRDASMDERSEAESLLHEMCGLDDKPDYDTIATRIAYWIVYNRVMTECQEELAAYRDELEELRSEELSEDCDSMIQAELDKIEECGIY
jgi:hypothetical protein